jgi:outer membrane protein
MKKIIILSYFLCLSVLCTQAQQKWTLRQCIDYAIENNIDIQIEALKVKNAEVNLSTSKNSRLPNLNASVDQSFSFGQVTDYATNTNVTNNANGARLSVSSSMPLFTGFKIPNQVKMDKLDLQAATEGLNRAKDNMELQVTSLYLDVLFKKEIKKVYQDQLSLTITQVEKTESLVKAGRVPMSQYYDIKAQQASDELNITTADNDLNLSLLTLSQALNLNEATNFDVEEPMIFDVVEENISSIRPAQDIYQTALITKPHIKEVEYQIESAKKGIKVAQAGYYPTLTFNMGYSTSLQRRYGAPNDSWTNQFRDNGSEYLGFTLSIPIFNRFQVRNQVRTARISVENNILALDNVKLSLYKEIQQAHQNATAAQAKLNSTEKAYDAAEEAFRYTEESYQAGKSTVFELNEAQTKLLNSKSEQVQAKYDFLFRAKILDFYRGEQITIE